MFLSSTVFKVHGAERVQRLHQQFHQSHGAHQEGLRVQTCLPGLPEGARRFTPSCSNPLPHPPFEEAVSTFQSWRAELCFQKSDHIHVHKEIYIAIFTYIDMLKTSSRFYFKHFLYLLSGISPLRFCKH